MVMNLDSIRHELMTYDGKEISLMEICGSHTAAIARFGIKSLLSPNIRLISGPGCPVCVTISSYIDRLLELSFKERTCVVTFGDLLRVPGSVESLNEAKGRGARVEMVYSPMDIIPLARKEKDTDFVFAAVGFETTTPVYGLLLEQVLAQNIHNVKLLTSLKTMPAAVSFLLENGSTVDGFLAPGHVCAITGSRIFEPLAKKFHVPMVVSGFGDQELLLALYQLVDLCKNKRDQVLNAYPSVVTEEGNKIAQEKVNHFFTPSDAAWRGMGVIPDSGMVLRQEFQQFDAGSYDLVTDQKRNKACCCDRILTGKMEPKECPLFGKACTPLSPQGACMVSEEGSCRQSIRYENR